MRADAKFLGLMERWVRGIDFFGHGLSGCVSGDGVDAAEVGEGIQGAVSSRILNSGKELKA